MLNSPRLPERRRHRPAAPSSALLGCSVLLEGGCVALPPLAEEVAARWADACGGAEQRVVALAAGEPVVAPPPGCPFGPPVPVFLPLGLP